MRERKPAPDAAVASGIQTSPRRWWVLLALVLVVIAFDLNLTMVNVALPTLATDLGASSAQLQWFSSSYSLMVAAALLPAGVIGDRFGPKQPLILALVVLGATALLCTRASSPGELIAGQLVLGVSAGFLPALTLALVKMTFPRHELTRALAIWSVGMTVGIPLGPIAGGYLTSHFGWPSIYLLNVPLVLVGAIMLGALLPPQGGSRAARLDPVGALLSSFGIIASVYGLTLTGEAGWGSAPVLLALGMGAVLLVAFVLWLRRARHPIVDPALFQSPGFRGGVILSTLVTFALMGAVFTLPQYFHVVHGAEAIGTGLRLMPVVGGLLAGVFFTGLIQRRAGRHVIIAAGFGLLGLGAACGAMFASDERYLVTALWLVVAGSGIGLTMPSSIDLAMGSVPERQSGAGSGTLQAIRQVGGTLGIAILGTLLAGAYSSRVDVTGLSPTDAVAVRRTASAGLEVAARGGDAGLADSVRWSFIAGMETTLWASAVIALAGVALAFVLARPPGEPAHDAQ